MKYRLPATMAIAALAATAGLATQPHPAAAAAPDDAVCLVHRTRTQPSTSRYTTVIVGYCDRWTMYRNTTPPPPPDTGQDGGTGKPGSGGFVERPCSSIEVPPRELLDALNSRYGAVGRALGSAIVGRSDAESVLDEVVQSTLAKAAEVDSARTETRRLTDLYNGANGSETSGTTRGGNKIPLVSQVDVTAPYGPELKSAITNLNRLTRLHSLLRDEVARKEDAAAARHSEVVSLTAEYFAIEHQIDDIEAGRNCQYPTE